MADVYHLYLILFKYNQYVRESEYKWELEYDFYLMWFSGLNLLHNWASLRAL